MIRHIVLFKFRPGISWDDAAAQAAEKISLGHPEHIPEIQNWKAGRDISGRPDAYDFAITGEFADQAALSRFQVHPDHQRGVVAWQAISSWIVADLAVPDEAEPASHPVAVGAGTRR